MIFCPVPGALHATGDHAVAAGARGRPRTLHGGRLRERTATSFPGSCRRNPRGRGRPSASQTAAEAKIASPLRLQRGRGRRFWNDEPTGICCLLGRRAEALRAYLASPGWGDCSGRGCAPRQFSDLAPQPLVPARVDCLRPKMRHCLAEASSARAADGSRRGGVVNVRLKYI